MSFLLHRILEKLFGKVHIYIFVGERKAAELILEDKTVTVDIKNPILAVEAAIEEMARKKRLGSAKLKDLKSMGYKVKIKYKVFEVEL